MLARIMVLSLAVVWAVGSVSADLPAGEESLDISAVMSKMMVPGAKPSGGDEKEFPDFKEVTKGMTAQEGMFTLWSYGPDKNGKDAEKLLCQIPASMLGQKFMLSTSVSGGGFFTGFPLDERVVQWEILGKQLLLIEPQTQYVVNASKEVADVVQRTYPDRIRVAVPILTKSPGGDPVINLGSLLKSDFADISWMVFRPTGEEGLPLFGTAPRGGGGINASLSKWTKKKTFPHNVEIGVELAVGRFSPPGSYDKKMVHYSFWKLLESDYQPRVADDRIGYFLTANQDWSKPNDSRDIFNRYIDRWHLEKRDPSLKLCAPKKPIIFYIEKTVPVKYRRAVRDGILEWNKAFEKIGFLNAVVVRQQDDGNEWEHLDPEDMRYSFFRWIVTGGGFAMGPHRSNPFTGQIYDADIVFDDSMVRYFELSARRMLPSTDVDRKLSDPALQAFLKQHPQWRRPTRDWERYVLGDCDDTRVRQAALQRLRQRGHHCCDYMEGMKHQMAVAGAMLAGQPKEVIDRFLYEIMKEVVTHEVGHTLGLRHNFKASTIYSLDEIKKRRGTGEATVGSVMDYNSPLFFTENGEEDLFITPTIGPWDYWVIEYGYRPADGTYGDDKEDEGDDKKTKDEGKKKTKTEKPDAKSVKMKMAGSPSVNMDNIPKEILDQLPPEIKKMMASGDMQAMMAAGGGMPKSGGKPSGPSFKGAPSGEENMLRAIASRCNEPELIYGTDEDASFLAPDPTVCRFDVGKDPLHWARARMELVDKRMADILEWAVKDQESWYHLRGAFLTLMSEKSRVLDYVGRYVGGQYYNRNHRGDDGHTVPFTLVSPQGQREALAFIDEHLFNDKFFDVSPEVLNHLATSRWSHAGASIDNIVDFPMHDLIAAMQWSTLFDLLFPNTLRRIHDAEMKTDGSDIFTAAEYVQRLQKACWADATNIKQLNRGTWTDNKPFISSIRRSLQREYLGLVEPMVRLQPGAVLSPDLHAMVRYSLQKLSNDLDKVVKADKADFASQAHAVACKSRIDRMLAVKLDEYANWSMPGGMFMHETGGK